MIKTKAKIFLYGENIGRKAPFTSGYRPLFLFSGGTLTSGHIQLLDRKEVCPGENAIVMVAFLSDEFLGPKFGVSSTFTFGEGSRLVGEGEILEVESE